MHLWRGRVRLAVTVVAAAILVAGCRSPVKRAEQMSLAADQLVAAGNYGAAAGTLSAATSLDGNNPDLWLKLGHVLVRIGDGTAANVAFQRALDLAPDNLDAMENLVVLAVRANEMETAKKLVQPLLLLQPNDYAGLLAQGAIALRERHYDDAKDAADKLIAGDPTLPESHVLRAHALDAMGRTREAIQALEKQSAAQPDNADYLLLLLQLYRKLGDVNGVRALAPRLHQRFPDKTSYAMEAARALHAQGRDAEAHAIVAGLTQRYPRAPAIIQTAVAFWRDTLPVAAARAELLRLAAANPVARILVADAFLDMTDARTAAALVRPLAGGAVTSDNLDAVVAHARALAMLGQGRVARARVDQVLAFDPSNITALLLRGRMRLAAHDLDGALADAQLAASQDRTNEDAALLVPAIQAAQGDDALAQQSYALAIQSFPDSLRLVQVYGDWLLATRQPGIAIEAARTFARRHARDAAAWTNYARLCRTTANSCLAEATARTL